MSGSITDIKGITVGHYTDKKAKTGCTAVICQKGAVAGVDVRGSAPGTRETDLLRGYNSVERVQAIMLSGGSAYGLDAASGAMQYFEEQGLGVDVGIGVVPIVPAAVIFDLGVGDPKVRPGKAEGYAACKDAKDSTPSGSIGAGTGATVAKAFGSRYAVNSGLGTACIELENGVKVGAIAVVNALGDIYDPETGELVAAAHTLHGFSGSGAGGLRQHHHRRGGDQCKAHPGGSKQAGFNGTRRAGHDHTPRAYLAGWRYLLCNVHRRKGV